MFNSVFNSPFLSGYFFLNLTSEECAVFALIEAVIFQLDRLFQSDETSSVMSAGDVMLALVTP